MNTRARVDSPSSVHVSKLTSATSLGSIHVAGPFNGGLVENGLVLVATRGDLFVHAGERSVVEARAHVAHVLQLIFVPEAEQQCAQRAALAFAGGEAADDELVRREGFELQPMRRATAGLISAVLALGDGAFKSRGERGLSATLRPSSEA